LSSDDKVSPAAAAQDCIGIAVKDAAIGAQCSVLTSGRVKVKAGAAVARGKAVYGADASKRVLQLTDQAVNEGGSANYTVYYNRKLGTALETTTVADGDSLATQLFEHEHFGLGLLQVLVHTCICVDEGEDRADYAEDF